jgi:hypothetical protein
MTGFSFLLSDLETGRVLAHAVLCPDARYAAMMGYGQLRLERQFATSFQWVLIEQQLARRLDTGPLHRASAVVALLVDLDRRASIVVQHLMSTPLDVEPPDAVAMLDAHLQECAEMPLFM